MELEVDKNDKEATQNIQGEIESYNKTQQQAKKIIAMINE